MHYLIKLKKVLMPGVLQSINHSKKMCRQTERPKDRQKDGRTDQPYVIRPFQQLPGSNNNNTEKFGNTENNIGKQL